MRLIDADRLINTLIECNDGLKSRDARTVIEIIIELVERQPTAYNVDKVVEQLREKLEQSYYDGTRRNGKSIAYGENIAYQKAIDIVKRGGVE